MSGQLWYVEKIASNLGFLELTRCVCVCVHDRERGGMRKLRGREDDEDEREARDIDWEVTEQCTVIIPHGSESLKLQHTLASVCLCVSF